MSLKSQLLDRIPLGAEKIVLRYRPGQAKGNVSLAVDGKQSVVIKRVPAGLGGAFMASQIIMHLRGKPWNLAKNHTEWVNQTKAVTIVGTKHVVWRYLKKNFRG